jgi:SAM-dependent methyltransferase
MLRTIAKYSGFAIASMRQTGVWRNLSDLLSEVIFDLRHGVETCVPRELSSLDIASPALKDGVQYQASNPRLVRVLIDALPSEARAARFVDFGCGKGRVLLLAAEAGFTRLTGIEFSPALAHAARQNLGRVLSLNIKHEVLTIDAASFTIPDEPVVLFFYNPFGGETLDRVLDNIRRRIESSSAKIWVIYLNPKWIESFRGAGLVVRHAIGNNCDITCVILTSEQTIRQCGPISD